MGNHFGVRSNKAYNQTEKDYTNVLFEMNFFKKRHLLLSRNIFTIKAHIKDIHSR